MATDLTHRETQKLSAMECDFRSHMMAFEKSGMDNLPAMGAILESIREQKLYVQYGTFEDYVENRLSVTRRRAYQLIEYHKDTDLLEQAVKEGLCTMVHKPTERAMRELSGLPDETKVTAIKAATKDGHKPTAANVRKAREEVAPKNKGAVSDYFDSKSTTAAGNGQSKTDVPRQDAAAVSFNFSPHIKSLEKLMRFADSVKEHKGRIKEYVAVEKSYRDLHGSMKALEERVSK